MAEEQTPGPDGATGTPASGPQGATGSDSSTAANGQPATQTGDGTTASGSHSTAEDTFFDPKDLEGKPELLAGYKQMQAAWTKAMQKVSADRRKIEAYDAFAADPMAQIQQIASRMGYTLSRAGVQHASIDTSGQSSTLGDWEPKTWDDVLARAEERAEQRIMQRLGPVLNQVQTMRKTTIEQQLSEIDPTWQQYEEPMKANLAKHPTLSTDPVMLYRLSVPADVLESRATQQALKKLEARAQSSQVSGASTTTKSPKVGLPDKPVSFKDAVEAARAALAEQGISRPSA